jgi:hypothetical protein
MFYLERIREESLLVRELHSFIHISSHYVPEIFLTMGIWSKK